MGGWFQESSPAWLCRVGIVCHSKGWRQSWFSAWLPHPCRQRLCLAFLLSACFIRALPSFFLDKGSIHKIVELPDGVQNIMELQVFPKKDPIQSMILDHKRVGLCLLRRKESSGSGCSFKSRQQGRQGQMV